MGVGRGEAWETEIEFPVWVHSTALTTIHLLYFIWISNNLDIRLWTIFILPIAYLFLYTRGTYTMSGMFQSGVMLHLRQSFKQMEGRQGFLPVWIEWTTVKFWIYFSVFSLNSEMIDYLRWRMRGDTWVAIWSLYILPSLTSALSKTLYLTNVHLRPLRVKGRWALVKGCVVGYISSSGKECSVF